MIECEFKGNSEKKPQKSLNSFQEGRVKRSLEDCNPIIFNDGHFPRLLDQI